MPEVIPVAILSGFLGSGKTSLLNRALRTPHGRRVAVVVNELGEIGIDGSLITGSENFVELDNGCLCCALNEDLVTILGEIGERDVDNVVIETTGVADPLPIGHSVTRPELKDRFRLDSLVTTVDCLNLERGLEEAEECALQIRRADVLVLTKTDLIDEARVAEVERILREHNEYARIIRGSDPASLELVLDASEVGGPSLFGERGHDHDHEHDHEHEQNPEPKHGFQTLSIDVGDASTIRIAFEEFLESLPMEVYRAKGIVRLEEELGRLVYHCVGGRVDLWHDEERDGPGQLVFIGKGLDTAQLREEVELLFGIA